VVCLAWIKIEKKPQNDFISILMVIRTGVDPATHGFSNISCAYYSIFFNYCSKSL